MPGALRERRSSRLAGATRVSRRLRHSGYIPTRLFLTIEQLPAYLARVSQYMTRARVRRARLASATGERRRSGRLVRIPGVYVTDTARQR